jgi:hypothetical protein
MSQKSGKNPLIIVLVIVGIIALVCCGITVGGGFFAFNAGMNEINKSKPYVSGIAKKLSDANYDIAAIKSDLDTSLTPDQLATMKKDVAAAGAQLGKFQNLTADLPIFTVNSSDVNGKKTTIQTMGFTGKFEKGEARIMLTAVLDSNAKKLTNVEFIRK